MNDGRIPLPMGLRSIDLHSGQRRKELAGRSREPIKITRRPWNQLGKAFSRAGSSEPTMRVTLHHGKLNLF